MPHYIMTYYGNDVASAFCLQWNRFSRLAKLVCLIVIVVLETKTRRKL